VRSCMHPTESAKAALPPKPGRRIEDLLLQEKISAVGEALPADSTWEFPGSQGQTGQLFSCLPSGEAAVLVKQWLLNDGAIWARLNKVRCWSSQLRRSRQQLMALWNRSVNKSFCTKSSHRVSMTVYG
jgi:hypothetical protein